MKRETVREHVMQLLYQMDINDSFDIEEIIPVEEYEHVLKEKQARETLAAVKEHISEIDDMISSNLTGWKLSRIAKTDLAILRVATCEMMYIPSIPNSVSINEAVNLSKEYGSERSYAFINSVLSKVNKALTDE